MRKRILIAFVLAMIVVQATSTLAWGPAGHKIIASIAFRRLSPEQQAKVVALLKKHPSVGSTSIFGVQMLQFCSSIFGGELPIDCCLTAVSFVLPSSGFIGERLFVRILRARHCRVRTFNSISAMLSQLPCLGVWTTSKRRISRWASSGGKASYKRAEAVRVEVVHHQRDPLRLRPMDIDQLANGLGPIGLGALVGDHKVPPADQRLREREHVSRSIAFVLIVETLTSPSRGAKRSLRFDGQLFAQLIHANQRVARIVRALISFQHVFHVVDKLRVVLRRDAPHAFLPGLQLIFFRQRRTVSCDTASTMSNSTTRWANSRNVTRMA